MSTVSNPISTKKRTYTQEEIDQMIDFIVEMGRNWLVSTRPVGNNHVAQFRRNVIWAFNTRGRVTEDAQNGTPSQEANPS